MSLPEPGFTAILLAGQRAGGLDALAASVDVPNKSLVPICGRPLIAHVAAALQATPGLARLRVVVEPLNARRVLDALPRGSVMAETVGAAGNLADSVYAAAEGVEGPILITTSDNVLLTPGAVRAVLEALANGADVAVALAAEASVKAAHPNGQRRFYRFADGAWSNCNLYGLSGAPAVRAAESFRSGGQFAKKPLRMVLHLGPLNLILLLAGRLSLGGVFARLSRRLRLRITPVILADGAHAIDVDNARTYACAEHLLEARAAAGRAAA
jgi:GTP:adenosylcobinamide-phosphate guanylyltransferase